MVYKFNNGYGASVVCNPGTYGYEDGLSELAVLIFDENGGYELCYETPITSDVIGNLTDDDIVYFLNKIRKLKRKGE